MDVPTLTKLCSRCYEVKPISAFGKQKKHKDGLKYSCKECDKIYRGTHPQIIIQNHKAHLKRKYGISKEEYDLLYDKQKGCCAICGRHQSELKVALCVDHDHATGKIRGLLCKNCNLLLGYAEDSRGVLIKAMQYLRRK